MIGEVIDLRLDRFLREMRDSGSLSRACENSGIDVAEFNALCAADIKFDRAQVECSLQYIEDEIMTEARKQLGKVRITAYADLQQRHGLTVPIETRGALDDTNCG